MAPKRRRALPAWDLVSFVLALLLSVSLTNPIAAQTSRKTKPTKARFETYTGQLQIEIDPKSGRVLHAKMSKGTGKRYLDDAAIQGIYKARFKPGTVPHVRIPVKIQIKIEP